MIRGITGLRAWIVQRISAAYMALFVVFAMGYLVFTPPGSFSEWKQMVANPVMAMAMALFFFSLLMHCWVGIRDVFIDYVPIIPLRLVLLTLFGLGFIACGFWVVQILVLARLGA